MLGGGLKGSQILGQYPDDLSDASPLNTGRGRIIPTMSWEAPFNAIAEWLGIREETELDSAIPNRRTFWSDILRERDVFSEVESKGDKQCACEEKPTSCDLSLDNNSLK